MTFAGAIGSTSLSLLLATSCHANDDKGVTQRSKILDAESIRFGRKDAERILFSVPTTMAMMINSVTGRADKKQLAKIVLCGFDTACDLLLSSCRRESCRATIF